MHEVRWKVEYDNGEILNQFEGEIEHRKKDVDVSRVRRVMVFVDGKMVVDFEKTADEELIGPHYLVRGTVFKPTQKRTLVVGHRGKDYNVEYDISVDTGKVAVINGATT